MQKTVVFLSRSFGSQKSLYIYGKKVVTPSLISYKNSNIVNVSMWTKPNKAT